MIHCFTSASFGYLDRARVLALSLRKFHPDWRLYLCLVDREPEGFVFSLAEEPFDELVRIEELDIPGSEGWVFQHDVVELSTAVKGAMLSHLLVCGATKVIYLDPDIAVFASLEEVVGLLDAHDIILTPHQLVPDTDRRVIRDNEIGSLKWGIYNLGFLAVANRAEGRRFAQWWWDRLYHFCFDDVPGGLFTDQRWCDHVPSFFSSTHILRDAGYNVASWNLSQRVISIEADGSIRAGGRLLRFFHFTKIRTVGALMLEHYASGRIEVFELIEWYLDRLDSNVVRGLPNDWWAFGRYDNGDPIEPAHRRAYRLNLDLQVRYPNPFAVSGDIFDRSAPSRV